MNQSSSVSAVEKPAPRSRGTKLFLGFLGTVATLYFVILSYHLAVPPKTVQGESPLDQCRRVCMELGIVPTGHIANDARAYLNAFHSKKLSDELSVLLSDADFDPVPSQEHPLLGQPAPRFGLFNDRGERVWLKDSLIQGPTVVVFYYGYGCSHCVAQLFAINDDLKHFRELGANVIALSPDSPQDTAEQFAKYGRFDFPVVSDPDNKAAERYSTLLPAKSGRPEDQLHGTFVINREGNVIWAYRGPTPFLDNKTLLYVLAGAVPTPVTTKPAEDNP